MYANEPVRSMPPDLQHSFFSIISYIAVKHYKCFAPTPSQGWEFRPGSEDFTSFLHFEGFLL